MQTVGRRASLGFAVFALSAGLVGAEGGVQAITARAESRGLERTMLLAPGQSLVPMPLPIVGGDTWSYMKGIAEPPADWATVSFDDASWLLGPSGFGFGDGDDQTVLSEMRYAYSTVYTRRHSDLVSLIGIRHVVLAVNKMDLVDYSHDPFAQIEQDCREFAKRIGLEDVTCIPISGVKGDNIVERSPRTPWYHGSTLMEHLETVEIDENRIQRLPFRMPVQWVSRPNLEFRGFAGTVAAGVIRPGDRIRVQPSGRTSTVSRIVTADGDRWTAGARCGEPRPTSSSRGRTPRRGEASRSRSCSTSRCWEVSRRPRSSRGTRTVDRSAFRGSAPRTRPRISADRTTAVCSGSRGPLFSSRRESGPRSSRSGSVSPPMSPS